MRIGIAGAMEVEVEDLIAALEGASKEERAGLTFYEGTLGPHEVVVVRAGIGKVAAGVCVSLLLDAFGCEAIINTGVAGAVAPELSIGDIVVSQDAVYHDVDVTALGYALGHMPGQPAVFEASEPLATHLEAALASAVSPATRVVRGRIATGDSFVASVGERERILAQTGAACCEMEGTACAQVAHAHGALWVVVRAMSDTASGESVTEYPQFEARMAHKLAQAVVACIKSL